MNFSTPNDFKYVTGDLDKIEIDNDIMPVRATEDKRKLRGMDIAFLQEAVEERRRFIGMPPSTKSFDTAISASKINDIYSSMLPLKGADGCGRFISGSPVKVITDDIYYNTPAFCGDMADTGIDVEKFPKWKSIVLSEGDGIKDSDISALYENIRPCVRAEMPRKSLYDKVSFTHDSYISDESDSHLRSFLNRFEEYHVAYGMFGYWDVNSSLIKTCTSELDISNFGNAIEASENSKGNEFWTKIDLMEDVSGRELWRNSKVIFTKIPSDEITGKLTFEPLLNEAKSLLVYGGDFPTEYLKDGMSYWVEINIRFVYWEIADLVDRTRWS